MPDAPDAPTILLASFTSALDHLSAAFAHIDATSPLTGRNWVPQDARVIEVGRTWPGLTEGDVP